MYLAVVNASDHLNNRSFLEQFENGDFVLKTQHQIMKDFELSGHQFHPVLRNTEFSLDDLTEIVSEMLAEVLDKGERQTLQLLYQIDLPQAEFLNEVENPDFLRVLSGKIIRRAAYKVYLRSKF